MTTREERMLLHRIETEAITLMSEHGVLGRYNFKWDRAVGRFGQCSHTKRTLSLSAPLAIANGFDCMIETMKHEIAHALAGPGHGHDATWRAMCRITGAKPQRCKVAAVTPPHKYEGVCKRCGQVAGKAHRLSKLMWDDAPRHYIHPACARVAGSAAARLIWGEV